MKLIKARYEIMPQESGMDGMLKQIERAGRTCYKSEDRITENSAKEFVERMIKSGHGAMLEHGTIYLTIPANKAVDPVGYNWVVNSFGDNPYSAVRFHNNSYYITTNYRVIIENHWLDCIDWKYQCEPTEYHEKRISVRFICDRGVSHEFVRHRVFSFAQESTRFCNYSENKFNNELTFIMPCWINTDITGRYRQDPEVFLKAKSDTYVDRGHASEINILTAFAQSEKMYFKLLSDGWAPQQARAVLPNAIKTELVMTGFVSDWKHFFSLRDSEKAHPQAFELAHPLHEEFIKNKWINE